MEAGVEVELDLLMQLPWTLVEVWALEASENLSLVL